MKKLFVLLILLSFVLAPAPAFAGKGIDGWIPAAAPESDPVGTVTLVHSDYAVARLEFDYVQSTGAVLRFRCVNESDYYLRGTVYENDIVIWSARCSPHSTSIYPINRFNIEWDLVDGGLIMGNYGIASSFPDG